MVINSIVGMIDEAMIITNSIEDIKKLRISFMNVQFNYCNRATNKKEIRLLKELTIVQSIIIQELGISLW